MESDVKIIPDEKLAVINYKGSIDDLDVLISKIMGWVEAEEIEVLSEPFVVYYSSRHEVNNVDVVFDVGIVLKDDEDEKDIIRLPWQHMQEPYGRVCNEGYGKKAWA